MPAYDYYLNYIRLEGVCATSPCKCHFSGNRLTLKATLAPRRWTGLAVRAASTWISCPSADARAMAFPLPSLMTIRQKIEIALLMVWSWTNGMYDAVALLPRLPGRTAPGFVLPRNLKLISTASPCAIEPTGKFRLFARVFPQCVASLFMPPNASVGSI